MSNAQNIQKRMIVGLGMTGLSAARWCQQRGYAFDLCDTRDALANFAEIQTEFSDSRIVLGELNGELLSEYDELVVSPGVAVSTPAIRQAQKAGVKISGDIQLFAEHCDKPIIAITGSNGKSTVTTLVGELLQAAGMNTGVGGNIGVPALDLPDADIYVLELSSFQLETTTDLAAKAAVILNLSEDHMDRYSGMGDYLAAKQRIFQQAENILVNRDDAATYPTSGGYAMSFGLSEPAAENEYGLKTVDGLRYICCGEKALVSAADLKIKGLHNLANVMAALALCKLAGVNAEEVLPALKSFAGLDHRCQWLGEKDGVAYYNDSKGTNVASTLAAINGLGADINGKVLLLAGGVGKGQDFSPLAPACSEFVREAFTYGADGPQIAAAIKDQCAVKACSTVDEALQAATAKAERGDVILLSPACASFDQFKSYVDRGNYFRQLVEAAL